MSVLEHSQSLSVSFIPSKCIIAMCPTLCLLPWFLLCDWWHIDRIINISIYDLPLGSEWMHDQCVPSHDVALIPVLYITDYFKAGRWQFFLKQLYWLTDYIWRMPRGACMHVMHWTAIDASSCSRHYYSAIDKSFHSRTFGLGLASCLWLV